MSEVTAYELRRVKDGVVEVRVLLSNHHDFMWSPHPSYTPIGMLQLYRRPLGKKRWFKVGERFSYGS